MRIHIPILNRVKRRFFILPVVIILIGILAWFFIFREKPQEFTTATIERGSIEQIVTASGKLTSDEVIELSFRTNGKIAWIGPKVGDKLTKDQAIATLDKRELEITLSQKEATLRSAQSDLEKVLDDVRLFRFSNPGITETQTQKNLREKAEAAVSAAFEGVQAAKVALKDTSLLSPIEGILVSKNTSLGQNVAANQIVFKVADFGKIIFVAEIDETDIGKIKVGQTAKVRLDTFPARELNGQVLLIHPETSLTTTGATIVKTEIGLGGFDFPIQLGLSGDVEILIDKKENTLTIPVEAVVEAEGKKWIFTVIDGRAWKKEVRLGLTSEEKVEVLEGLTQDSIVITSDLDKVKDGQKISFKR